METWLFKCQSRRETYTNVEREKEIRVDIDTHFFNCNYSLVGFWKYEQKIKTLLYTKHCGRKFGSPKTLFTRTYKKCIKYLIDLKIFSTKKDLDHIRKLCFTEMFREAENISALFWVVLELYRPGPVTKCSNLMFKIFTWRRTWKNWFASKFSCRSLSSWLTNPDLQDRYQLSIVSRSREVVLQWSAFCHQECIRSRRFSSNVRMWWYLLELDLRCRMLQFLMAVDQWSLPFDLEHKVASCNMLNQTRLISLQACRDVVSWSVTFHCISSIVVLQVDLPWCIGYLAV